MPGESIGNMMKLMPACGLPSVEVRTSANIQSAAWAWLVQILEPLMTYSSPSRAARVFNEARSLPLPGSE